MTLTSSVQDVSYDTDGATVDYPIPFYFIEDSDIVVDRIDANNNLVTLSLGTDYTVSGAGNLNGGTASMTGAIARGFTLHIYREVPVTQETQYQQNDPFPAKSTETAFDKLTMICQQLASGVINAIRYPLSEFSRNGVLPPASSRAQMLLGWDANGQQEMVPRPSSIGAGDMVIDTFVVGVDFQPGDTTLQLSRAPISPANCWMYWDGVPQLDFSVAGTTATFPSGIADGITQIKARIGTTLSVGTPPQSSVGDDQINWNGILARTVGSYTELRALSKTRYDRALYVGSAPGSIYQLDGADTTSVDDGFLVIVASDGGRWKRLDKTVMTPEMFNAQGGTADDTLAFQAMAAVLRVLGGGVVIISQPHNVFTTPVAAGATLMDLTGCRGVTVIYERGGLINAVYPNGTTNIATAWIYVFNDVQGFKAINARLTANSNIPTVSGVVHFAVSTTGLANPQSYNLEFENVNQAGGLGGLIVYPSGTSNAHAARIRMTGSFNGTFYPANLQANGDDFVGDYIVRNCGRGYFMYNASNHDVSVDSNNGTAFDDIDISCYTDPDFRETSNIHVRYKNYGSASIGNAVAINFVQSDATSRPAIMHGIHIEYDMFLGTYPGAYLAINKYNSGSPGAPGAPDDTARGYDLYDVTISGNANGNAVQNCVQAFTSSNWTGERVRDIKFKNLNMVAAAGSFFALDGRGFMTSTGALLFDNVNIAPADSLVNIPQNVLMYRNATFSTGRRDGDVAGNWIITYPSPGIAHVVTKTPVSIAPGGTQVTLPLSDKRGSNPAVFAMPIGGAVTVALNYNTAQTFTLSHNGAGALNFNISADIYV